MRMLSFAVLSTWTFTSFSGNCGRGADGAGTGAVCICSVCVFSTAGGGILPVEAVEADEGLRNNARAFVARAYAKGSLIETGWIRIPITVCYMNRGSVGSRLPGLAITEARTKQAAVADWPGPARQCRSVPGWRTS